MRQHKAIKRVARKHAADTGEKYVTAQKLVASSPLAPASAPGTAFPCEAHRPIPTTLPSCVADVTRMYADFRMQLGVNQSGEIVEIDPRSHPHTLVLGYGDGQYLMRALIEERRAAGWMIFRADRLSHNYPTVGLPPGVVAVCERDMPDYIRVVRMVADEVRDRLANSTTSRLTGRARTHIPILLALPVFNDLDIYGDCAAHILDELRYIATHGGPARVHLLISAENSPTDTLPADLLAAINHVVYIRYRGDGTPWRTVLPDWVNHAADELSESTPGSGEGLSYTTAPERSVTALKMFSADGDFYDQDDAHMKRYISEVSARVPRLHPRLWFAVDDEQYGETLESLYALPAVTLDHANGTPDPAMVQYDPTHPSYNGVRTHSAELEPSRAFAFTRLQRICEAISVTLDPPTARYPDDVSTSFTVHATKSGQFAGEDSRSAVHNRLTESTGTPWNSVANGDTMTFTLIAPAVPCDGVADSLRHR